MTQGEILIMKKENKKLAQERRAKERKQKAIKDMVSKICKIGIPSLLLLLIIVIAVVNPFAAKDTDADTTNDATAEDTTDNTTLLTDTSLEITDGDTVNIDYVGSIDGVEFDGGNTQGMGADLTIGSGTYIDDFEQQLIGAHPGDEVDVYATFPENYGNDALNGKEALFKVVINGIYSYE